MAKGAKKVLISGYIGFGNFGDEAIFSSLVSYLKAKGVEVSALSSNKKYTEKEYSIKAYNYKCPFSILKAVMSCDILFSGGGSLLQNKTSNKSLYYYLSIINLAKIFRKKVVIFAQGFEGISGNKQIKFVQKTLKKCDLITVRDEVSKKILEDLEIKSTLVCDPVYSLNLPEYNPCGYVGIQLRKYNLMHKDFLNNLADAVLVRFGDKKIKIIPFEESNDREICLEFKKLLKEKKDDVEADVVNDTSIQNIIKEFSTLEYLVAMRFHACILGSAFNIKTTPVVYDNKVLNLSKRENLTYIDCSREDDIKTKIKDIEKASFKNKPIFNWNIFDNIIQQKEIR